MSTIKAVIHRHALSGYFALTFLISWGLVLLVIGGIGAIPGNFEENERLLPLGIAAMLAGPSVAGLLWTGLGSGQVGFRQLWTRLLRWRVETRWYAIALLFAPLLALAILLPLSLLSPDFLPGVLASEEPESLLQLGILGGLSAGFFEEIGWTGFAIPRVRARHSVLGTGLLVGALWGAWHFLVNFWGSGTESGDLALGLLLPALLVSVLVLPPYRVLMVWVYDRTESLLVAMLMHLSLTSSMLILQPVATGTPRTIYFLLFSTVLWIAAGTVGWKGRPAR